MNYEWEQEARDGVMPHIADLNEMLKGRFQIWGVAIVNEETGEACYEPVNRPSGEVFCADAAKDVLGDAQAAYSDAMTAMRYRYLSGKD